LSQYTTYSDEQLIKLLHKSDQSAFKIIYDRLYAHCSFYAGYFLKSPEDVKDILTDCFIKAWEKRQSFENLNKLKSFLEVSIRNACFNHLRRTSMISRHQAAIIEFLESENTPEHHELELHLQEAELLRLIHHEIEQLHPQCKNIFKLAFFDELKNAEIAKRLNINIQTVYNQKNIAIKSLRCSLKNSRIELATMLIICFIQK
jgi:RNA polymerase sigma-70 factor (family 1)